MDRRVYAAFGLLISTFITIVWFIIPQPPDEALVGMRFRSARHIDSYPFTVVPGGPPWASVQVFEGTLHDGSRQLRAYVTFDDRPPQYLGPLTRQLDDAPMQTILVRAGNDRVIMGRVDESVSWPYDPNILLVSSKINPLSKRLDILQGQTLKHSFSIGIHADETERWSTITKMYIWSAGSINRSAERDRNRDDSHDSFDKDLDSDWVRQFNPPLDIEHLFIPVGDEYVGYPPTQQ